MKKLISFLLTICLFIAGVHTHAQTKAEDVQSFTLKNGMKFLVLEDNSIPNATMYLYWKVGSRNEHEGITGISHFFEHMMFNGAKKYGPKMFDNKMEFNGGENNAYTTQNVTVYYEGFPSSALEVIFDLESDRIASLTIDPVMVKSEREVVLSERRTDLENSPYNLLFQSVYEAAFQEHPYHWPVLGYETDIKNWTKEDLENYFKTYYAPNNCVAVISGNVKFDEVKKLAQQYFEPIPAQAPPAPIHSVEPPQTGERRVVIQRAVTAPYLLIGYHVPEARDSDYYALQILSNILSTGESSRLYSSLVNKKQLATNVFSYYEDSFDPTLFMIGAVANQDGQETELEDSIYAEMEKIKKSGISEQELQKAKNQKLMEFYSSIETNAGKANSLGEYETLFGDYKKMFDAPAEYNQVTAAEVKRMANKYFKKSNRTVGIIKTNTEN